MFRVDRIEDRGTMHGVQVQLVMGSSEHSWNSEYFKDKMLLMQARKNGVTLDEEQLLFIAGGQDNVVDDDVEGLSTQYPVYNEVGPSYDLDILSEVHDHDQYQDIVCEHHEVHEMHDDVQPNYVVDSHNCYTSDSNMISYDQYVKDNAVQVVQSDVSVVPNDAYMMILNDIHELPAQHVYVTTQTKAVYKSLTVELATYKKQVELYERHARFKLTKREQKIDEQLRIVITDRNIKKENLKKKLHYVKMQLASTINHNKSMVEKVTSLKKDFKQKENQYLEEFLDMKALKEKVLTIEIKEIKTIIDELEAEVDQNAVNRKCDEIERKNLLIANDTLIANCLNNREVHLYYLKHLKESVATLREIVEEAKVERPLDRSVASACLYTKHSQELLEYVIDTCPKDFNKRDKKQATTPLNRKKQSTFADQYETSNTNTQKHVEQQVTQKTNVLMLPSTRVDSRIAASGSKPKSNTKKNRISPAKSVNKKTVKDHSRTNKSHLQKLNRVDSSISSKPLSVKYVINALFRLIMIFRFRIDHFGAIMGYGDYVIGDSAIFKVYYVEGLGHNLFSVGQFCDSDLEVAFRKHSCYV
nr:integrase, catalytic region, zinc finger, CCHC-type, peptidase aspartic, catalytic [Tanacetum cinerariifolium]